ncbi:Leucine-rich receptor-like kinase family protein [Melia azedarach]|uniref:Leucine-rich receptor-like kinase family protein n=1 Tax=Melia azedarach TaxID=155640 RepID=A0ACC1Y4W8_MELAZ|nr:Leucine-rich receptor-like kinase family protein [Melia azedarach]
MAMRCERKHPHRTVERRVALKKSGEKLTEEEQLVLVRKRSECSSSGFLVEIFQSILHLHTSNRPQLWGFGKRKREKNHSAFTTTMSSKLFQYLFMFLFSVTLFQLEAGVADSNRIRCIEEEREALLKFKASLVDESGFLSTWGREDEKRNCCRWRGVRYLSMGYNNLSKPSDWAQVVTKLPSLKSLDLTACNLPPFIPSSLLHFNYSSSFETIYIFNNSLTSSSIYPWLFNISTNLTHLDLTSNLLQGSIPDAFGQMVSLCRLYLSLNEFEDGIPKFFGNMCRIDISDFSSNKLKRQFSEYIQNLSCGCTKNSLGTLRLNNNQITGSMPDLSIFSPLRALHLSQNRLNGTITNSVGQLFNLHSLSLGDNSLEGVISEALFSTLSYLMYLQLGGNSLTLNFSHDWVPPFQLNYIYLSSCKMGPHFPNWLRTQSQIYQLESPMLESQIMSLIGFGIYPLD